MYSFYTLIPNLQIHKFVSGNFYWFLLKQGRIFLSSSKMLLNRHFAASLKENKTFFVKKIGENIS